MEGAGERGGGGAHGVGGPRGAFRVLVRREEEDDKEGPHGSERRRGCEGGTGLELSWAEGKSEGAVGPAWPAASEVFFFEFFLFLILKPELEK